MKAMLLIALCPVVLLLAHPFGYISFQMLVNLVGIGAAAH